MQLNELVDIRLGTVLSRANSYEQAKEYPIITIEAIENPEIEFTREYLTTDNSKLLIAKKNDLIISLTQNRSFLIDDRLEGLVIPSRFVCLTIKDTKQLDAGYLHWYFNFSTEFKKQLHTIKSGSQITNFIKVTDLKELTITLPTLEKQQFIARMVGKLEQEKYLYQKKIKINEQLLNNLDYLCLKEN